MQNTIAAGARKATSPLRYAVGMFGTSITIYMFTASSPTVRAPDGAAAGYG